MYAPGWTESLFAVYHPKPPATCCLKSWIPIIFHQSLSFSILIVDFTTLPIEISFLPKLAPLRLMGRFSFTCHGLGAVARVPLGNQRWCSRHLWRCSSEAGWVFFLPPWFWMPSGHKFSLICFPHIVLTVKSVSCVRLGVPKASLQDIMDRVLFFWVVCGYFSKQ